MTPLRQRMIEDLRMRNRSSGTISAYVAQVARFAKFYDRSPEDLSQEDVRAYLLRIIKEGRISWSHYNVIVCALRFLYRVTLCKDWPMERLPYAKRPKKLPTVLSPAEVVRLLECVSQLRHRMVLMTMYATGLRVSEAIRLRRRTSTANGCWSMYAKAKGARTAWCRWLLCCWRPCVSIGGLSARGNGCFRGAEHDHTSMSNPPQWPRLVRRPREGRGCRNGPPPTRCVTALRPTSWKPTRTFARSRCCWGTGNSARRRFIRT